jgi:hypothetical protein
VGACVRPENFQHVLFEINEPGFALSRAAGLQKQVLDDSRRNNPLRWRSLNSGIGGMMI